MKRFVYCCYLFLLSVSCTNGAYTNKPSNPPSPELVQFCSEFIARNRSTDTSRLVVKGLYEELIYDSVQHFDKQPFYPVSMENSRIIRFLQNELPDKLPLFEKTTGVWGFFYFRQDGDLFPDGVIEEWIFRSEEEAKEAIQAIHSSGDLIFFNTQPYFCVVKNRLYVFHTRAMAFSVDQKPLFQEFVQRTGANR
ncbi:hypothetical protein [Fluviicola sp.]|uniref:hypothetical protein n=1 Tax=Fluviicola sp. TaxID=1917219 RepID=UPI0031DB0C6E